MSFKTGHEESNGEKRCVIFPRLSCSSPHPTSVQQLQSRPSCSRSSVREHPCPTAGAARARPSSPALLAMHTQGEGITAGFFTGDIVRVGRRARRKRTFFKMKINDLALRQAARCGWGSPALLGMLEKEVLSPALTRACRGPSLSCCEVPLSSAPVKTP